jgi:4-diphosphocytidyl-2-C-methyl-D-erythritol kinase
MILRVQAPAKINRELRVGSRAPDGYHPILSRFTSIELADELEAEPAEGLSFSTQGEPSPADDSNLVVRAARSLAARAGVPPRARIRLTKRVPSGSGLGGGSSDAAAALVLLCRLWELRLEEKEIGDLAAGIGSDVPFFLLGGEADVSGRGERVDPREDIPGSEILLLVPPFPLSTEKVYAVYDALERSPRPIPSRLEIESSGRFFGPNDLASAVLQTDLRMATYLRTAREFASEVSITGSGSTIVLSGSSIDAWQIVDRHPEVRLYGSRTLGRREFRRRINPTAGGATWT